MLSRALRVCLQELGGDNLNFTLGLETGGGVAPTAAGHEYIRRPLRIPQIGIPQERVWGDLSSHWAPVRRQLESISEGSSAGPRNLPAPKKPVQCLLCKEVI